MIVDVQNEEELNACCVNDNALEEKVACYERSVDFPVADTREAQRTQRSAS